VKETTQGEVNDNPCMIQADQDPITDRGPAVFVNTNKAVENSA
jgi:hypothetical protein